MCDGRDDVLGSGVVLKTSSPSTRCVTGPSGGVVGGCHPPAPRMSPRHFAARRDESVIVGYYTSAGSASAAADGRKEARLWQEGTGLTVPV